MGRGLGVCPERKPPHFRAPETCPCAATVRPFTPLERAPGPVRSQMSASARTWYAQGWHQNPPRAVPRPPPIHTSSPRAGPPHGPPSLTKTAVSCRAPVWPSPHHSLAACKSELLVRRPASQVVSIPSLSPAISVCSTTSSSLPFAGCRSGFIGHLYVYPQILPQPRSVLNKLLCISSPHDHLAPTPSDLSPTYRFSTLL